MKHVLIIGASSAIAEACARTWAQQGHKLFLAARNAQQLQAIEADLRTRGAAHVGHAVFDALAFDSHVTLLDTASTAMGGLDTVLIAHGTLSDQERAQRDNAYALREIETNGTSVVSIMGLCAERLAPQGHGCIAVISSVAGDRGRQSNYVYGSAKALVSAFASGLRQRLTPLGVNVLTIKPGFVDTPMTASFKKGALWAQPAQVARDITRAVDRGQGELYTPWFWWGIMFIIRHVPERIFRRLKL